MGRSSLPPKLTRLSLARDAVQAIERAVQSKRRNWISVRGRSVAVLAREPSSHEHEGGDLVDVILLR